MTTRTLGGEYTGWVPRAVRVKAMGRAVRAYLDYHARNFGAHWQSPLWMTHEVDAQLVRMGAVRLPWGWRKLRVVDRNAYVVGPWWYIEAVRFSDRAICWLVAVGAVRVEVHCPSLTTRLHWWPSCPRFSDYDEVR